jgi:hypothetical protein
VFIPRWAKLCTAYISTYIPWHFQRTGKTAFNLGKHPSLHSWGLANSRGSWVECRGSWVKSRGSWVKSRGSWIKSRGSWVQSRGSWVKSRGSRIKSRVSREKSRGSRERQSWVPNKKSWVLRKCRGFQAKHFHIFTFLTLECMFFFF